MANRVALVTGASGFTGSHLCQALLGRGYHVRAMVRSIENSKALRGLDVELVEGDLAGPIASDRLQGVDTVYHIAAVYRKEGVPREYFYNVNADGTSRLLEASLQAGVSRFVHCSTIGVLGDIQNPPADENTPYNPHDIYQESKMEGEKRALRFHEETGLPVSVVRPAGIYGPGDRRFLKLFRAINRRFFWMLGKGDHTYHFVYIDDLVEGFILAGEKPQAVGEVFIIAGEAPIQVKELVRMIARTLDRPAARGHLPVKPVMAAAELCQRVCLRLGIEPPLYPRRLDFFTMNRAFDISKARDVLGYQPRFRLENGLKCTAEWYRANGYL